MEIHLERVSVTLGGRATLREVDLRVAPGETVAIVGPSGSGKSTLLRAINGLARPDAGVVRLDGAPLDYRRVEQARRRMGYVMQEPGLFPHLTVADNVGLLPRVAGWEPDRVRARVAELLRMVALDDEALWRRGPRALSGGQRQRVAIARALALDPPALLMDEPFSALDPVVRAELHAQFARVRAAAPRTVVLVTHDFSEAHRLADRIVLVAGGRVEQDAAPTEFVARPATPLAAAFVASARGVA